MRLLTLSIAFLLGVPVLAQPEGGFYDQDELGAMLYAHRDSLELIPQVTFRYHVVRHDRLNNSVLGRMEMYREVGNGDVRLGREMLTGPVEFFNGVRLNNLSIGDTLIIPSHFNVDFRAYSPFPRYYPGAEGLDKLFIIHKGVQAWAGYEHGRLVRWGIVNTGAEGSRTPAGRYNFNWQEPRRVSTLSPPGEQWLMRWVFNFHNERGIHIHQYSMPAGQPASHGCVRMIMADAQWVYNWADPWQTTAGHGSRGHPTTQGRIIRQGTTVLVLGEGEEPNGIPRRFVHTEAGPALRVVELPASPFDVPAGSPQQVAFDRIRRQSGGRTGP
jgi:hypothetical protein